MKVIKSKVVSQVLSYALALALIIGLMPGMNVEVKAAGDEYSFGYAYDCQRSPAFPKKGQECSLSGFTTPVGGTQSQGSWTISYFALYKNLNDTDKNQVSWVSRAISDYGGNSTDNVPIYELKFNGASFTKGILVAVTEDKKKALFIGNDNNGYFLSDTEATSNISITVSKDLADYLEEYANGEPAKEDEVPEDTVIHPDGSKTVTEVKEEGSKNIITVTDYNKTGEQISQFIYEGAKDENIDLRTVNYSGKEIKVPATVTGGGKTYKVTRLRKNFMKKCTKARKLDIGSNITQIDERALNGGKRLKNIVIRGKLKKVGKNAFKSLRKGKIKIKTGYKTYKKNRRLIEKSGIREGVVIKRIKNKKK